MIMETTCVWMTWVISSQCQLVRVYVQMNIMQGLSSPINPVLQVFAKCLGHAFVKDLLARRLADWCVKWELLYCLPGLQCRYPTVVVVLYITAGPVLFILQPLDILRDFGLSFCGFQWAACHFWSLLQDDYCYKIALDTNYPLISNASRFPLIPFIILGDLRDE